MGHSVWAPGTRVVAYAQESPMWASRLWWLLRYFGFDDVRVLDGGLEAWRRAGYEVSSARRSPEQVRFVGAAPAGAVGHERRRPTGRGRGTGMSRQRPHAAGLPRRRPRCLQQAGPHPRVGERTGAGPFRPRDLVLSGRETSSRAQLAALLESDPDLPVIAYCGGGISATVDVFVLSMLGRDDVLLYDGSLTEWSADPDLPLEVG